MKKSLLITGILGLITIISFGQTRVPASPDQVHPVSGEPLKFCGSTEAEQDLFKNNPHLIKEAEELKQLENERALNHKEKLNAQGQPPIYKIPVVVHILHNFGTENIPDANVHDAIRILNEDFRKMNADISQVVPAFTGITGDAEVEFALAQLDPNGNCTNGIVRLATQETYVGDDGSKIGQWPRSKYLNIYTVNNISSGAAGYTYVPGSVNGSPSIDAIIILANYFGSLSPASNFTSRALTHEIGHWFNLYHTWGTTNQPGVSCNGSDNVSDTPTTKGWTSCNLTNNKVCNPSVEENVQNFLDYSYCYKMFTQGQCSRMRSALASSTAQRNNLWSSSNLTATGVSTPAQLCTADFTSDRNVMCVTSTVNFTDLSWNKTPTTWAWDFDNDGTTDATTQNPSHQYSAPGLYTVKLTVGDGTTTKSVTKTSMMVVLDNKASTQAPYSEGFESSSFPYTDFYTTSASFNNYNWNRTTNASYTGSASIKLDNYTQSTGDKDEFITPSIDMSQVTSPTMTFRLAYQRRSSSDDQDELKVFTSSNCGGTWVQRYSKKGASLATLSATSGSPFTPSSTSHWRQESVSIPNVTGQADARFRFTFNSNGPGNNVYIDDINITGTGASVEEELLGGFGLNVFPNPFTDQSVISFNLQDKYEVSLGIVDMIGKEVLAVSKPAALSAGEYSLPVDKGTLTPGVYFVKLNVEGYSTVKKIIVQ